MTLCRMLAPGRTQEQPASLRSFTISCLVLEYVPYLQQCTVPQVPDSHRRTLKLIVRLGDCAMSLGAIRWYFH